MGILLSCGDISTVWLHFLDRNETLEEKGSWELHKNSICGFEQILLTAPNKTAVVRPLTSHLINHPRKAGKLYLHNWRNKDELINGVHQWTPTHWRTNIGQATKIYIHLLCAVVTVGRLEDIYRVVTDRDRWKRDKTNKNTSFASSTFKIVLNYFRP